VLVQAGQSGAGISLAARRAELVFSAPALMITIGRTEAEARTLRFPLSSTTAARCRLPGGVVVTGGNCAAGSEITGSATG